MVKLGSVDVQYDGTLEHTRLAVVMNANTLETAPVHVSLACLAHPVAPIWIIEIYCP